jgi:hypothetical protein
VDGKFDEEAYRLLDGCMAKLAGGCSPIGRPILRKVLPGFRFAPSRRLRQLPSDVAPIVHQSDANIQQAVGLHGPRNALQAELLLLIEDFVLLGPWFMVGIRDMDVNRLQTLIGYGRTVLDAMEKLVRVHEEYRDNVWRAISTGY